VYQVTVFGQSAGAISISLLYLQPNLNLFSRAVSGTHAP
jgi:carboxylesterase type B